MGVTPFHSAMASVNRGERKWALLSQCSLISTSSRSPDCLNFFQSNSNHKSNTAKMAPEAIADCTLLDLFEHTAFNTPGKGLLIYDRGPMEKGPIILSYNNLKSIADGRGKQLLPYVNLEENPVILLHVNNHQDGLVWFWAILAAGGIPCISTPLSKHVEQRQKHLESLQKLLDNPLVLTTNVLAPEFAGVKNIHIKTIDEIVTTPSQGGTVLGGYKKHRSDLAVLMLTSGSTGNSKAVAFTHKQIIHALGVKASHHKTTPDTVFLNWTGLDHVANLIEIHLHALAFGAAQVHVPSSTILADPMVFLELISKHRVSYTFAPNFFLAVLVQKFLSPEYSTALREKGNVCAASLTSTIADFLSQRFRPRALPGRDSNLDLSCLRSLISGGESNVVQTCRALTVLLRIFRAPETFIRPGFGMTETCAGCIYNSVDCPEYDLSLNSEFACLGDCVAGISFRITRADGSEAARNEIGEMQVKGDVVFEKYYNDQESTEKSFTKDGWFRTGDRGFRDSKGRLHLTGRDKDTVVING
jgi:acyl-CoA synthetase (AMP-forming)/AMP-acid ligase II